MILVDTSIWVDHFADSVDALGRLIDDQLVVTHPMVIGELALGSIRDRAATLGFLDDLPSLLVASHREVRRLIERAPLNARGIGLVDAHLLATVLITPDARLLTRDRRLRAVAEELGVAA